MTQKNKHLSWFRQAEEDLRWAEDSLKTGHYPQTCFIAQQVGEKAIKALAFFRGAELAKGHSITKIANLLKINNEIEKAGKRLDQYYISSRYPDSFPDGIPSDFFTKEQAAEAITLCLVILNKVRNEIS